MLKMDSFSNEAKRKSRNNYSAINPNIFIAELESK